MMRTTINATLLLTFAAATASAQSPAIPSAHDDLDWKPAPAVLPPGAMMAVLEGDPAGSGMFTVRLLLPNGYRLAPHTRPTDENVTVISGRLAVGIGATFDTRHMLTLAAGGFVNAPANLPHYAVAHGVTVVQVHALGPFRLTYVDPTDTPRISAQR
jgi:quercetin dioxygenase-like cupin family protein